MKGARFVPHSPHKRNQTIQPNSSDLPHPTAKHSFHLLQNSRRLWVVHPTSSDIKENDQQWPNAIISILGTILQRFHVLRYRLAHVTFDEIRNDAGRDIRLATLQSPCQQLIVQHTQTTVGLRVSLQRFCLEIGSIVSNSINNTPRFFAHLALSISSVLLSSTFRVSPLRT
jgi:hypothetical protein